MESRRAGDANARPAHPSRIGTWITPRVSACMRRKAATSPRCSPLPEGEGFRTWRRRARVRARDAWGERVRGYAPSVGGSIPSVLNLSSAGGSIPSVLNLSSSPGSVRMHRQLNRPASSPALSRRSMPLRLRQ